MGGEQIGPHQRPRRWVSGEVQRQILGRFCRSSDQALVREPPTSGTRPFRPSKPQRASPDPIIAYPAPDEEKEQLRW
jgi:hypothetical protein